MSSQQQALQRWSRRAGQWPTGPDGAEPAPAVPSTLLQKLASGLGKAVH